MKGVILAGGLATRLRPLTWVTNKHLLPIYNKPMIYYSLEAMQRAGMEEVLIVTGPDHAGAFLNLIKSGEDFGFRVSYEIQKEAGGIAQGIALAESFADEKPILVLLGDNIFFYNLKSSVEDFMEKPNGAKIFAIEMSTELKQYGVVEIDSSGKVLSIEEKPQNPKSNLVQTGVYMYDKRVFDFIRGQNPSGRGELEVTDLNNFYVREGMLRCELLDWWVDAGTSFDELLRANNMVAEKVKKGELQ